MIVVLGWLRVAPEERAAFLTSCRPVIEAARATDGCVDFHIAADPIEPGRVNVVEQWSSVAAVETFRGGGPSSQMMNAVIDAHVEQHVVSSSTQLT